MKSIITYATLTALLVSCGKEDIKPHNPEPTWSYTNISKSIVEPTKADDDCFTSLTSEQVSSFYIERFINGVTVKEDLSFENQIVENYIKSKERTPISQSYYGKREDVIRDFTYNKSAGEYYLTDINSYKDKVHSRLDYLFVCPANDYKFNTHTYENMGLNISYSITKTFKAIERAVPTFYLSSVSLNVAPVKYIDVKYRGGPKHATRIKGYEANNAYYSPADRMITFLPQSELYHKAQQPPLWQTAMVGSHEYGHHIFATLMSPYKDVNSLKSHSCFRNVTTTSNEKYVQTEADYHTTQSFAIRAMNEGFADLISFYSLGNQERSLKNVFCMSKNREVDSKTYQDGTEKVLTKEVIDILNGKREAPKTIPSCKSPSLTQIHDIGSFIAYTIDQKLTRYNFTKDEKLKVIIEWLPKFFESIKDNDDIKAGDAIVKSLEILDSHIQ